MGKHLCSQQMVYQVYSAVRQIMKHQKTNYMQCAPSTEVAIREASEKYAIDIIQIDKYIHHYVK